jgi:hypothetical protein
MPKLSDWKPGNNLFALFIGRSGSGKSSASCSFDIPHVCDFDGRMGGVANYKDIIGHEVLYNTYLPGKAKWPEIDKYLEILNIPQSRSTKTEIIAGLGSMARVFMVESMTLQKGYVVGDQKSGLRISGVADYGYESSAVLQVLDYLKMLSLSMNVICEAHILDKYGKPGLEDTGAMTPLELESWKKQILESVILGEKLDLRDKLENVVHGKFDEVYRFEKREEKGKDKFYVKFKGDLARTSLNLPPGEHDITGKNFYHFWCECLGKEK